MKVAIDGPAGSGKSTIARSISRDLAFTYLDTGAMYRSIALLALESGIALDDEASLVRLATSVTFDFLPDADLFQRIVVNGADVSTRIRTPQIDVCASKVSRVGALRTQMVSLQRELGNSGNVIAEGRDIGTVVFPDAEVKVFLEADARTRAHRRYLQNLQRTSTDETSIDEEELYREILERDRADSSRAVSPLVCAADARRIDSTHMSISEVVQLIEDLIGDAGKVQC